MEGHLLSISPTMAVTAKILISYGGSCGIKFWFQYKCCLTELWQVDGVGHKAIGMHWAWRSGKGKGLARTGLARTMKMERWELEHELERG